MRDQVQRWLSACIVAGHDTPDGDNSHVSFEVDAPTLEALCSRWIAVEDAPIVDVTDCNNPKRKLPNDPWGVSWDDFPTIKCRIVPEQGEGDRG